MNPFFGRFGATAKRFGGTLTFADDINVLANALANLCVLHDWLPVHMISTVLSAFLCPLCLCVLL